MNRDTPDSTEPDRYKRPMSVQEKERLKIQHKNWINTIIFHSIAGFSMGTLIVISLIWFDVNHIGTMVLSSDKKIAFIALLIAGFGSTFGMAVTGTAIWFKATEDDT